MITGFLSSFVIIQPITSPAKAPRNDPFKTSSTSITAVLVARTPPVMASAIVQYIVLISFLLHIVFDHAKQMGPGLQFCNSRFFDSWAGSSILNCNTAGPARSLLLTPTDCFDLSLGCAPARNNGCLPKTRWEHESLSR